MILLPILGLLAVGLVLALNSGAVAAGARGGLRVVAENFSAILIRVAGYLAVMMAVQRFIGSPPLMDW
jgi:hypothetical protein